MKTLCYAVALISATLLSQSAYAKAFTFKCYLDRNADGISWKFSKTVVVVADDQAKGEVKAFDECYSDYSAANKPSKASITKKIDLSR
jgi:hypothetical protein